MTEERMRQAMRDLSDIADQALLRVETMPRTWQEEEPVEWWQLHWLRDRALRAEAVLENGIACFLARKGQGPMMDALGPRDLELPRVRESLDRCVRAARHVAGEFLVGSPAEPEDVEILQWAQTVLAGTAPQPCTACPEG